MIALLTGGAGFIGTNLARVLLALGVEVVALGRSPCKVKGVVSISTNRLDRSSLDAVLTRYQFDSVFHLAAAGVHPADRDRDELIRVNATIPAEVVAAAKAAGVAAVVLLGSSAEYAAQRNSTLGEDEILETRKMYGASKAAGSLLAIATGIEQTLPVAVLRAFNVYGPGEAAHRLLPSLALKLHRREHVQLSPGTQIRDFIFVDDVCDALCATATCLRDGTMSTGAYNLSTGVGTTVGDFARTVAREMGADVSLLNFGALQFRPDDLPIVVGNSARLQAATGWHPSRSVQQGVGESLLRLALN
jgi:nucleoside-diphosphate-sugar epimerase